jgi:superfamily II DNA helicase RecQ
MFFQYMPDELLRRLIESPPKSIEELRDDFEVHNKIIENFGKRILHLLSAGQEQNHRQEQGQGRSQTPHANQTRASEERVSRIGATILDEAPRKSKERTSRAKVAAAREVAGGKVGTLYGRAVEARFERLRTLRLELARKNNWPAFCVLQDATLLEIARAQPRTMRELLEIKGMGPKRGEKFGKELLAELAKG